MNSATKTQKELLAEIENLRLRLEEAEETLRAIGSGEVDAFVVSTPEGQQQVFTLKGAEQPYRILVESMNEGAATLAADGTILYCNKRLSTMLKTRLESLIGTKLGTYVGQQYYLIYNALLENCTQESQSEEIAMTTAAGNSIPVLMSCCANDISGTRGISVVVTDLTLQRRNEDILASEKFTTSIIEQTSDAMLVCDAKGKIIRASLSAHELCGTNPLLKPFNKTFPLRINESGEKFALLPHIRSGMNASIEVHFKRNDGRIVTLLLNATRHKSILNNDIACIVTLIDITERKLTEDALHMSELRLQAAYSHLQRVNEELQVASEELHAQGEELQNQNQELKELWERSKASEEAVKLSEERLALAASATQIGMFDWNIAKGTVLWTQTHHAIFGYAPATTTTTTTTEYDQRRWSDRVHPEDLQLIEEESRRCMQERKPLEVQYRIIWPDGSLHWVETKGVYQYESNGTASRLIGVVRDITERKQTEQELINIHAELEARIEERTSDLAKTINILEKEVLERQKAEQNLYRLNRLYAVLSETNHAIVKVRDRDSLFRDFCRIAVEHGGFILTWIGLVDEQTGEVQIVASSGATAYLEDIRISKNKEPAGEGPTGIAIRGGTNYICNDFLNDPCTRPWHEQAKAHGLCASASIAIKENDRVIGALTLYSGEKDYFDTQQVELLIQMGMDISFALDNLNRDIRRKEAEKALYEETIERLQAIEALREKEQMLIQQSRQAAMGEMIGNIAHQWRQPLNVLGITIQQQLLFWDLGEYTREYLEKSNNKSMELIQHMSKTIDDFKNYFKPEKEMIEFSVHEAVENTLSLLEGSLQHPKINIEIETKNEPVINGYRNEYSQVLLNILTNAKDAIVEREINDPRIMITICSEDNRAVVIVADNGGGIPEDIIEKIFDPYFTTKGLQQGTGIGLFMSKTIIEKNMDGRLTVRNIPSGAEFRIEVPSGSHA